MVKIDDPFISEISFPTLVNWRDVKTSLKLIRNKDSCSTDRRCEIDKAIATIETEMNKFREILGWTIDLLEERKD